MFVSKENALNKAWAKYLEYSLYMMAKESDRCKIANKSVPSKSSLSETDETEVLEYLDDLRLIMSAMGYKFLEKLQLDTNKEEPDEVCYIRSARLNIDASGKMVTDGFLIFKGSTIAYTDTDNIGGYTYSNLKNKLIADGTIKDNRFTKDCLFSSCSAASSVVKGYNTNGWIEWKNKDKKTLTDIFKESTQ